MLKKYSKNKYMLSTAVLAIAITSVVSIAAYANSDNKSATVEIETSTGEVLKVESSPSDYYAEITIETETGEVLEIK